MSSCRVRVPNDDLKFRLDGENVSPNTLASAMREFAKLLDDLTSELTPGARVKWALTGLSMSRPTVSVRPESKQANVPATLRTAYVGMWTSIRHGRPFPYSAKLRSRADSMTALINGEVTALWFEGDGEAIEITKAPEVVPTREMRITTFGRLEGRAKRLDDPQGARL